MNEPLLDFVGNPIVEGCYAVYPVRRGSAMWQVLVKVTQVVTDERPKITGYNRSGRRVTVHNIENVVVVNLPQTSRF